MMDSSTEQEGCGV